MWPIWKKINVKSFPIFKTGRRKDNYGHCRKSRSRRGKGISCSNVQWIISLKISSSQNICMGLVQYSHCFQSAWNVWHLRACAQPCMRKVDYSNHCFIDFAGFKYEINIAINLLIRWRALGSQIRDDVIESPTPIWQLTCCLLGAWYIIVPKNIEWQKPL